MLITLVDEFVSLGSTGASSVLSITLLVMSTLKYQRRVPLIVVSFRFVTVER